MQPSPTSCTIEVRLKPGSKQDLVEILASGAINARVKAPPVDGKANAALIKLLADVLDIPKSYLSIKRGETSKNKVLVIEGLSKEEVLGRLQ